MKFFGNVTKLEAAITAMEAAIQPDLEKAGITTALRDGKVIPIAEASITEKYVALRAAQPAGADLEGRAQLLASNKVVSDRCEKAESDLAIANTNVGVLTRENAQLKSELETERASVKTLTAEKSNEINLRDSAVKENARLSKELQGQKMALAKDCLVWGCVDFKGADGKALAKDASDADLAKAAEGMTFAELHTAHKGAVTSAAAKIGINITAVPGQSETANTPPPKPGSNLTGLERALAVHKAKQATK